MSKKRDVIGHIVCVVCDYPDAEVAEAGSGLAYVVCEECNRQDFCRSKKCDQKLRAKMRPVAAKPASPPPADPPKPKPKPAPATRQPVNRQQEKDNDERDDRDRRKSIYD